MFLSALLVDNSSFWSTQQNITHWTCGILNFRWSFSLIHDQGMNVWNVPKTYQSIKISLWFFYAFILWYLDVNILGMIEQFKLSLMHYCASDIAWKLAKKCSWNILFFVCFVPVFMPFTTFERTCLDLISSLF